MSDEPSTSGRHVTRLDEEPYFEAARRPLTILCFLLPFILAYEGALALSSNDVAPISGIKAHVSLLRFFDLFNLGVRGGLILGGVSIVVVLFAWHLLNRDPWRVRPRVIGLMLIESIFLTSILILLSQVVARVFPGLPELQAAAGAGAGSGAGESIQSMGVWPKIAMSVGAGLYEELLFRMMLIAVLHTLLVDVGKASHLLGMAIAVTVSAVAITVFHPLRDATGAISWSHAGVYFVAGLYFGVIYALRGFGIVVAVHAFYDIVVLLLLSGSPASG